MLTFAVFPPQVFQNYFFRIWNYSVKIQLYYKIQGTNPYSQVLSARMTIETFMSFFSSIELVFVLWGFLFFLLFIKWMYSWEILISRFRSYMIISFLEKLSGFYLGGIFSVSIVLWVLSKNLSVSTESVLLSQMITLQALFKRWINLISKVGFRENQLKSMNVSIYFRI